MGEPAGVFSPSLSLDLSLPFASSTEGENRVLLFGEPGLEESGDEVRADPAVERVGESSLSERGEYGGLVGDFDKDTRSSAVSRKRVSISAIGLCVERNER